MASAGIFLLLTLTACWMTIWHGFELGGDEHYEVTKAFLWSKGLKLYRQVWNDQQPLLTILQGLLFKCFGVSVGIARALGLAFGALLVAGLFRLVRKSCGTLAAFVSMISLLAAPHVFELTISPMNEVPAFALGLLSLWAVRRWYQHGGYRWLITSGMILAIALEIKLTAVILVPALGIELAALTFSRSTTRGFNDLVRNGLVWGTSFLAGFMILNLILGTGYTQAYSSHFAILRPEALSEIRQFRFNLGSLLRYRQALLAVGAALGLAIWRRHLKQITFPLALFATALLIHLFHRPFWSYYYLHFAVPIAWLTGYCIGELSKIALEGLRRVRRVSFNSIAFLLIAIILGTGLAAYAGIVLDYEIKKINAIHRFDSDSLVVKMREAAPFTHWIYTRATMYAFHARLRVIPELAVMPLKRYWSGQIRQSEIVKLVMRYKPEQLLLDDRDMEDEDMALFVNGNYRIAASESGFTLWLAADLAQLMLEEK